MLVGLMLATELLAVREVSLVAYVWPAIKSLI